MYNRHLPSSNDSNSMKITKTNHNHGGSRSLSNLHQILLQIMLTIIIIIQWMQEDKMKCKQYSNQMIWFKRQHLLTYCHSHSSSLNKITQTPALILCLVYHWNHSLKGKQNIQNKRKIIIISIKYSIRSICFYLLLPVLILLVFDKI